MPVIELVVSAKIDGQPLPGMPFSSRLSLTAGEAFDYQKASVAGYVSLPISAAIATALQALILKTDQNITVRLNGQSDAGMPVQAGGMLVILNGNGGGGATAATVQNTSGSTAQIKGYAGGS